MVLYNVTKFHKILIKSIRFRERTSSGQTYVITYVRKVRTGVTLNAPAIIMAGHKKCLKFYDIYHSPGDMTTYL